MGQWLGGGHGGQACFLQALLSTCKNPAQALMSPPDPALPPHVSFLHQEASFQQRKHVQVSQLTFPQYLCLRVRWGLE